MTWASMSIGRNVTRTGLFLKKQIWIWPVIATILLSIIAVTIRRAIEATMTENLQSQLQTLLDVDSAMLDSWAKVQMSIATSLANDQRIRESVATILVEQEERDEDGLRRTESETQKLLHKQVSPTMSSHSYAGYFIANKNRRVIASSHEELLGKKDIQQYANFLGRVLAGETVICPPFGSTIMMKDENDKLRSGVPTMFVCAPVRDANFEVIAVLGLRIRPELEFTRILQLGRFGESGETYAVNKTGLLVSNSRFDEALILLGILPDQPDAHSIVNLQIRDPQGDLTSGFRPKQRRSELPLTKSAAAIAAGTSGMDMTGYRDYRGVRTVGAWKWLPKYEIGVITEVDVAEAFRPLNILRRTFWALYALLVLCSIAVFIFTVIIERLRRNAQKAEIEAQQLGQYTLERKLAAGGMGVVYKGHHAMLRRETAIKMLDVDKVNDASIARFEREVQITCQLNHPNTVAIYDYGRTPEGNFYYAMEFLDGINLQTLVDRFGPQPEGRVISILTQVCGSLFEAHSLGLVHRDIKPANIMLNRRGGVADVIKVLDFGLVKAIDEKKKTESTSDNTLTGTPLYMAPEAIQAPNTVDSRSDLYAVGAVGYFLLTGRPVFEATGLVELCRQHVEAIPVAASERLGKPVSEELEHALLACLDKSRNKRPATARDLAQLLTRCPTAGTWTMDEAEAWWGRYERAATVPAPEPSKHATGQIFDRTVITEHPET